MSLEVRIRRTLRDFSLETAFTTSDGVLGILGASGCGKSMTLRCIAGIVRPDEGRIVLDGRVLFDSAQGIDLPPQQRNVGLLFQNYALFPNMTVEQNILCALKKEKDPAARRAACAEALRAMRLEELAKRLPGALSGGQQQRAALARILAAKPRILMLDEPFSALDSYLREEVEGEVGSLLAGFAGTALLVTHNRDEAYRLCREMIVMDGGEVLRAGTTKEVFADPRTRAAARLTGCKNILPCTRVGEHTVHLAGWEQPLTVALPVPEGCRAVGIRRVTVVDPYDLKEVTRVLKEDLAAEEPSVIISRRPCALLKYVKHKPALKVEPEKCIGCAMCATICPDAAITVYREVK